MLVMNGGTPAFNAAVRVADPGYYAGSGATSQTACPVGGTSAAAAAACTAEPGYAANSNGSFTSTANCASAIGFGMNWAGCSKPNTQFGNAAGTCCQIPSSIFTNADLSGSSFLGAYTGGNGTLILRGAILRNVDFGGGTFRQPMDLSGADLTGATNVSAFTGIATNFLPC
jgi:hypothetical protein